MKKAMKVGIKIQRSWELRFKILLEELLESIKNVISFDFILLLSMADFQKNGLFSRAWSCRSICLQGSS